MIIIIVESANEGQCEHWASRKAVHGTYTDRAGIELDPDRIDIDVIAREWGALRPKEPDRRFKFCF